MQRCTFLGMFEDVVYACYFLFLDCFLFLFLHSFAEGFPSQKISPTSIHQSPLSSLVPPHRILFLYVFCLYGNTPTTRNSYPLTSLPPSHAPTPQTCPPICTHTHIWTQHTYIDIPNPLFCCMISFHILLCGTWCSCVSVWRVCLGFLGCFPLVNALTPFTNTCAYVPPLFLSFHSLSR